MARASAAVALMAVLGALAGCARTPHHPGWVIHSAIHVVGTAPADGYRLVFPYIVGDFYGSPNTGDFVTPVSQAPGGFTLDLNRTRESLASELARTDFSLRFLEITPPQARIARLTPVALQRDGIESVGKVQWQDGPSGGPLMLVFIDRPARIAGALTRGGETIHYDVRATHPGYVWIGAVPEGQHATLYTVVPPPRHLVLVITVGALQRSSTVRPPNAAAPARSPST